LALISEERLTELYSAAHDIKDFTSKLHSCIVKGFIVQHQLSELSKQQTLFNLYPIVSCKLAKTDDAIQLQLAVTRNGATTTIILSFSCDASLGLHLTH